MVSRLRSTLSHTWDSAVVSGSTHIRTSGVRFQKPGKSAMKTKSSIRRLSRALVVASGTATWTFSTAKAVAAWRTALKPVS